MGPETGLGALARNINIFFYLYPVAAMQNAARDLLHKRETKKIRNSTNNYFIRTHTKKRYSELCHIIGYTHTFDVRCKKKFRLK